MASAAFGSRQQVLPVTLVWIDARSAIVATWEHGEAHTERVSGDVPPHERSVGHVRIDPTVRHGGGQRQDKLDHRRNDHERAYLDDVAGHLPTSGPIEIIGPGPLRLRLVHRLQSPSDGSPLTTAPSGPLTEAQLLARLRELAGQPAPRQLATTR